MKKIIILITMLFAVGFAWGQDLKREAELTAKEKKIPIAETANFIKNYIEVSRKLSLKKTVSITLPSFTTDICDDGGFETKNMSNWGWTTIANRKSGNNVVSFYNLTPSGSVFNYSTNYGYGGSNANLKWEIISSGTDPIFPSLPTIHSGNKALKLGREEEPGVLPNCGAESIMKTIAINAGNSNLSFWYALVLQDPINSINTHSASESPAFGVRVYDGPNVNYQTIIPVVSSPTNPIIASNNPFLNNVIVPRYSDSETIGLRPWTCGRVDLSAFIGKTITVEFVVNDCSHAGHFGYAYLDDICLGCQGSDMGDASISGISQNCGASALVSGNYTLPHSTTATGSLSSLQAQLYQNGSPFGSPITVPSSYINTSAKTFSFPISLFGTVPSGNYDIVITGNFSFSGSNYSTSSSTSGVISGSNNDWKPDCPNSLPPCCQNTLSFVTPVPSPPSYPYDNGTYAVEYYNVTAPTNLPITELKVQITSFEWIDAPEDCKQCRINSNNLGSLFGGLNIGGIYAGPNTTSYPNAVSTNTNTNEVIFSFPNGKNLNAGDFLRLTYLLPPEKNLACCQTKAKICRKISWKDINCGYCEVHDCSTVDLKNITELKTGATMPNLQMLYLNTRGIYLTGQAVG